MVQFGEEASQTRDYCVAKNATLRAARPDPSLRKERAFRMTIKRHRWQSCAVTIFGFYFCTIFLSVFQHAELDFIIFIENSGHHLASGAAGSCAHIS
jgi:hypothetical protein